MDGSRKDKTAYVVTGKIGRSAILGAEISYMGKNGVAAQAASSARLASTVSVSPSYTVPYGSARFRCRVCVRCFRLKVRAGFRHRRRFRGRDAAAINVSRIYGPVSSFTRQGKNGTPERVKGG